MTDPAGLDVAGGPLVPALAVRSEVRLYHENQEGRILTLGRSSRLLMDWAGSEGGLLMDWAGSEGGQGTAAPTRAGSEGGQGTAAPTRVSLLFTTCSHLLGCSLR